MSNKGHKQLAAAITLQAVKDFVEGYSRRKGFPLSKQQETILKELRSPYMEFITDGFSLVVAEQLEKHPDEIAERFRIHYDIV